MCSATGRKYPFRQYAPFLARTGLELRFKTLGPLLRTGPSALNIGVLVLLAHWRLKPLLEPP